MKRNEMECGVCGQSVPVAELGNHMAFEHREIVLAEVKRDKDETKPFLRIVAPSFAVWLVAFLLLLALPGAPPLAMSIPGMLLVLLGIVAVGYRYALRVTVSDAGCAMRSSPSRHISPIIARRILDTRDTSSLPERLPGVPQ